MGLHLTAVRRLTGDDSIDADFTQAWRDRDLDEKTRALLVYATKLTEYPQLIEDADVEALQAAGWDERGIWEVTTLIGLWNMTGSMDAASGLPADEYPDDAVIPEQMTGSPEGA